MNQQDKNPVDENPWNSIGSVSVNDGKTPVAGSAPAGGSAPSPRVELPPLPMEDQGAPRPDLMVEPSIEKPPVAPGAPASMPPAPAGSPAPASMPPAPVDPSEPAASPAAFPPPPRVPSPAAKSAGIAPLILGVASILLCFVPIASTIMGVAAIILAFRATRRGEYSGTLTAGKVTGIIGTVLSVLALILMALSLSLAARMYTSLASQDPGLDITQGYTAEQHNAWAAIDEKMAALAGQNPQDAAAIADAFSQYLNEDEELAPYMQGCDPDLYATWAVLGLEYADEGVFVSGDEGYAYVAVTLRDGAEMIDRWSTLLDQAASDPGLANTTDEEFSQIFRDTYLKALSESDEMYETTLVLDLQKSPDGTWMILDESWTESLVYLFGL